MQLRLESGSLFAAFSEARGQKHGPRHSRRRGGPDDLDRGALVDRDDDQLRNLGQVLDVRVGGHVVDALVRLVDEHHSTGELGLDQVPHYISSRTR